jgi:hypothetical protein
MFGSGYLAAVRRLDDDGARLSPIHRRHLEHDDHRESVRRAGQRPSGARSSSAILIVEDLIAILLVAA